MSYEKENPLAAEYIADNMLDYVTNLQIRADEAQTPITDPAVLRSIDDVIVASRALQKEANGKQDEGKIGSFYGIDNNFAVGEVLLVDESLFTNYEFEVSAAPEIELYLAKHVNPHTKEELFSEGTKLLGSLQSFRGAQRYEVGALSATDWNEYRTVALFSQSMGKIIGLAQIRGVVR